MGEEVMGSWRETGLKIEAVGAGAATEVPI